jgi:hypothetical protein
VGVDTCLPPLAPTYSITGTFDAGDAELVGAMLPEAEGDWADRRCDTTLFAPPLLQGGVRPRWGNNGEGDVIYSRELLPPPSGATLTLPLALAAGTDAEDADDDDDDDEFVPAEALLPVPAANITTPEAPPLPEPEAEGVLPADPLPALPPGLPVEDSR